MKVLLGHAAGSPVGDGPGEVSLAEIYAPPSTPWLRVNMVSTVDGSAAGGSGLSASINNDADHRVFSSLRAAADVIIVGAGTARAEGYGPAKAPIVLVSRRAQVPEGLRGAAPGAVRMATCSSSEGLAEARELLGADHVHVVGSHRVDLARLKAELAELGMVDQLCEGGPHLVRDLLYQQVSDELTATFVPRVVGGQHPRITTGPPVDVPLTLHLLVEDEGTLLGRWFV